MSPLSLIYISNVHIMSGIYCCFCYCVLYSYIFVDEDGKKEGTCAQDGTAEHSEVISKARVP